MILALARWAYSKWPFYLLLLLGIGQLWFSWPPSYSPDSLYIETSPKKCDIFRVQPELFLGLNAEGSGGTRETHIGKSPGPLHLSTDELPLSIIIKKDGYDDFEYRLQKGSFEDQVVYPKTLSLEAQNWPIQLRRFAEAYPFLVLTIFVAVLFTLGRRLGKKYKTYVDSELQKIYQGQVSLGMKLGDYKILEKIGTGGMGQVFKVEKVGEQNELALKLLDGVTDKNPEIVEAFNREVQAVAKVEDKGLLVLYDWGEIAHRLYLVTELLEGVTLKEKIQEERLSASVVRDIAIELCGILQSVHKEKLLHRDIKPSNIFLTSSGLKLLDFGVSSVMGRVGRKSGSVGYAPPEQLAGEANDARCDIYALGVTLSECLLGRPLFRGQTPAQILRAQKEFAGMQNCGAAGPELLQLLNEMVHPDVDRRPIRLGEILKRLKSFSAQ